MRCAFTLSEVAISLVIIAIGALTVFMVLPTGVRVQHGVRFKVLAAAKAVEMIDQLRNGTGLGLIDDARDMDKEGVFPWDSPVTYRAMAPDLEAALESLSGALKPLPEAIAARLDSEGDGIAHVLAEGGRIYYFAAGAPVSVLSSSGSAPLDQNQDPLYRKLLVGISGPPQQNAILYHPSTRLGPYQTFYPSPPSHLREWPLISANGTSDSRGGTSAWCFHINTDALCRDPAIAEVMASTDTYTLADGSTRHFGYRAYEDALMILTGETTPGSNTGTTLSNRDRVNNTLLSRVADHADSANPAAANFQLAKRACEAYVIAALWYAQQTGLTLAQLLALTAADGASLEPFVSANAAPEHWRRVLAMRYLAHAATCLTRWYPTGYPAAGADLGGSPAMAMTMGGFSGSGVMVRLEHLKAWHEASLRLATRHADLAGPYHWGASRPLNRQVMMDHPLVQLDPWSSPIEFSVPMAGGDHPPYIVGGRATSRQWRALYPQAIAVPGVPQSYTGRFADTNGDRVVDQRDAPTVGARTAHPARVLDRDGNGVLDQADLIVPGNAGAQSAVADPRHFNLTAPFNPDERCRLITFWAVDWQSYRDFESCPSADIDAARYPIVAPMSPYTGTSADPLGGDSPWVLRTPVQRQLNVQRGVTVTGNAIRNPELLTIYREPSIDNGALRSDPLYVIGEINDFGGLHENHAFNGQAPDLRFQGTQPALPAMFGDPNLWNMQLFLGRYGANRDNVVVDMANPFTDSGYPCVPAGAAGSTTSRMYPRGVATGGTVPSSTRLRAVTVGQFIYYDPRVQGALWR